MCIYVYICIQLYNCLFNIYILDCNATVASHCSFLDSRGRYVEPVYLFLDPRLGVGPLEALILAPFAALEKSSRCCRGGVGGGGGSSAGFRRFVPLLLGAAVVSVGRGVDGSRVGGAAVGMILVGLLGGRSLHSVALALRSLIGGSSTICC